MTTDFQNEVINRVRTLRIENDVSQALLAHLIEVSNGQIGNIESPRFQHKYTLKQLYLIARHFNVPLYYLLTGRKEEVSQNTLIEAIIRYDE